MAILAINAVALLEKPSINRIISVWTAFAGRQTPNGKDALKETILWSPTLIFARKQ
jgi:hypothetical protein